MVSVPDGGFHAGDLIVRKQLEMRFALGGRQLAVVLQTQADEQIDEAVRNICDLLNGLSCFVVTGKEVQFFQKLVVNSLPDEVVQGLGLGGHVDILVHRFSVVPDGHLTKVVQFIIDVLHQWNRKCLQ